MMTMIMMIMMIIITILPRHHAHYEVTWESTSRPSDQCIPAFARVGQQ